MKGLNAVGIRIAHDQLPRCSERHAHRMSELAIVRVQCADLAEEAAGLVVWTGTA